MKKFAFVVAVALTLALVASPSAKACNTGAGRTASVQTFSFNAFNPGVTVVSRGVAFNAFTPATIINVPSVVVQQRVFKQKTVQRGGKFKQKTKVR